MTNIILFGTIIFGVLFDLIVYKIYKRMPLIAGSIILAIPLIATVVMMFCHVQFEPFVFGCIMCGSVLCEYFCVVASFHKKAISVTCTIILTAFAIAFVMLHQSCIYKDFEGKEYAGVYSEQTGFGETKVTYYEKHGFLFISTDYYCIENYGVYLGKDPNFDSLEPTSIEYADKAE